ncbi:AEC family transporter [Zoogloea sp.]|uniref:AEC family transporter n=1 Tax=Zoogloea sp. TaxID=49181 RepID=UPI0035B3115D
MLTILGITGPIFLIVGVGFAAVRHGLLTRAEMRPLGVFVINVALPALLFKAMSARALGDLVDGHLLLVYALGSLLAAGLALAVSCLLRGRSLQVGAVQALGASMSNSAFIGYPIALQAMGPLAGSALAVYALVEGLLMMPLLLTLAEVAGSANRRWSAVLREILRRLTRNPFILAMGAGVLWTLLGVPLPVPVAKAVDMLSVASAPVALFCIGGTLAGLSLRGMAGDLSLIVAGKLLVHPLCVAAVLAVSPGSRPELATAAILNAGMPMLSIYPLLSQKFGQEGLSAAALVAATTLSFFTVSGLLWVLGT